MRASTGLVGAYLAVVAASAQAEPEVTRNETIYEISGETVADLVRELDRLGPFDINDGSRVWGQARWDIQWRYSFQETDSGCGLTDVTVDLNIRFFLPRWRDQDAGNRHTREAWSRMRTAMVKHEERHAHHGESAAREIETALRKMEPRPDCDAMAADANALGTRIIEEHVAKDIEYDRRTKHGVTEGVHLP